MDNSSINLDLKANTPLTDLTEKMSKVSGKNVVLREDALIGQINLRVNPDNDKFFQSLKNLTGIVPPQIPNNFTSEGNFRLYWLGPNEWLLTAPDNETVKLIDDLTKVTLDQHVSIVDVSDNRTCLSLSGQKSWTVLNKTCGMDIHPRTWQTGHCAQTLVARAQVLLAMTNDSEPEFKLFVRNSFAEYLARFLMEAMLEFVN